MAEAPRGFTELVVENIRRRPGMYIGDTGPCARGHLISFVSDQIADADRAEHERLEIVLSGGSARISSTITPPDVIERFRALESGALDEKTALNETWELLVVSALTSRFLFQAGSRTFEGARGVGRTSEGAGSATGFRVEFTLDAQLFGPDASLDSRFGLKRSRELAYVLPGLETSFRDSATGRTATWRAPGGMTDLVDELTADYRQPTWGLQGRWGDVSFDAAVHFERFELRDHVPFVCASFANTVPTRGGGSHTAALRRAVESAAEGLDSLSPFSWVGAISVRMPRPQLKFDGSTKDVLGVPGLVEGLAESMRSSLREHLVTTGVAYERRRPRR